MNGSHGRVDLIPHIATVNTSFPNAVVVMQGDHLETWQAYPAGDRIDECVMHASLYVPEPVTTDKAKRHWDANMDLLVRTVEQEDFPVNERILEGCRSGAQQRIVYGRNEPCLVHFHRSIRRALGMPDLSREETA